jgi:hypothetical protein
MDVKAFEKARADKLNGYKKEYEEKKRDYTITVDAAIQEADPKQQNDLIQNVLSINSELSDFLRTVIQDISQGDSKINSQTISNLNADLIKYQKEFQAVKQSQDKIKTLKILQATNSGLANTALTTYYIYLSVIGILVLIFVYLTISASWSTSMFERMSKVLEPELQ